MNWAAIGLQNGLDTGRVGAQEALEHAGVFAQPGQHGVDGSTQGCLGVVSVLPEMLLDPVLDDRFNVFSGVEVRRRPGPLGAGEEVESVARVVSGPQPR
ncbi:hypothetical protein ACOME3_008117 [Neoechinorhynchus agilis]